ncbi:hypothetical protein [Streptomyces erythrochromogenes]|uniref:hypothetical protein n=1 Tax=Streptomyces erythrochromogenes TaxID=285574 RepID=UPI0037CFDF2E
MRLSNYGCLAVVTTPAPDSHDDLAHAVRDGALSEADRSRIEAALSDLGYTLVPQRLLHRRYDGVTRLTDEGHLHRLPRPSGPCDVVDPLLRAPVTAAHTARIGIRPPAPSCAPHSR